LEACAQAEALKQLDSRGGGLDLGSWTRKQVSLPES
jgi:hypothetical protein